jgi:hypothetical protein
MASGYLVIFLMLPNLDRTEELECLLFIFSVMTKENFKRCGEGMVANSCEYSVFIMGVV